MLVLRWRVPDPPIVTRWRGPAGMLDALRRDPLAPLAGIVGPPGLAAGKTEIEAAEAIAAGQAVRVNPAGRLVLAQADSLAHARQVALAATGAAIGFAATIQADFVTLADWSAATGAPELVPGAEYFLSSAAVGQLVTTPPLTGVVLVIGTALNTTTMAVNPGPPILL